MLTVAPLTFISPLASTSIPAPDLILVAAEDLISISFASSLIEPCAALRTMSLSVVIVSVFSEVSMTMLFFSLLSMISIFSFPSSSVRRMTWPLRDLITRTLFLPSALSAGGVSVQFHNAPTT